MNIFYLEIAEQIDWERIFSIEIKKIVFVYFDTWKSIIKNFLVEKHMLVLLLNSNQLLYNTINNDRTPCNAKSTLNTEECGPSSSSVATPLCSSTKFYQQTRNNIQYNYVFVDMNPSLIYEWKWKEKFHNIIIIILYIGNNRNIDKWIEPLAMIMSNERFVSWNPNIRLHHTH